MKKKDIKNILKSESAHITPSPEWQKSTKERLSKLVANEPVTKIKVARTNSYLFNFISLFKMNSFAKLSLFAVATGVVIVGGSFAFATAANAATPNSPLFGIDKQIENIQRAFAVKPADKLKLEQDILKERVAELEADKKANNNIQKDLTEVSDQLDRISKAFDNAKSETAASEIKTELKDNLSESSNKLSDLKDATENEQEKQSIDEVKSKTENEIKDVEGQETEKVEPTETPEPTETKQAEPTETEKSGSTTRTSTPTPTKTETNDGGESGDN